MMSSNLFLVYQTATLPLELVTNQQLIENILIYIQSVKLDGSASLSIWPVKVPQ